MLLLTAAAPARKRPGGPDRNPPAPVRDLTAGVRSPHSIVLSWTAPGDNGNSGTATEYDVRYAANPVTPFDWDQAVTTRGEPRPSPSGNIDSFEVTGLEPGTTYHFALRTRDEVPGQWSELSRSIRAATPPDSGVMVLIPAGVFRMGSPKQEPERHAREERHDVRLTRPFYLSDHEVTQAEWRKVMGENPAEFKGDDRRPVEQVSWFDALDYCNRLSLLEILTPAYVIEEQSVTWDLAADGYRLPTEAEWEYACRAGTTLAFCSGVMTEPSCAPPDPNLDRVGWYCANSLARASPRGSATAAESRAPRFTHAVRQKLANAWGLFDMHGNVNEWCWDWLSDYHGRDTDPIGPPSGAYRVVRGGSTNYAARYCRAASRSGGLPTGRTSLIGFRVARNGDGPAAPSGTSE